ncbi:hypothetical protein AAMO2058_000874000 [Amorphochlora amoebiformis]
MPPTPSPRARRSCLEEIKEIEATLAGRHLIPAVRQGNVDKLKYAVRLGVPVNAKNKCGCTALICAGFEGKLDVIRYLVEEAAIVIRGEDLPREDLR